MRSRCRIATALPYGIVPGVVCAKRLTDDAVTYYKIRQALPTLTALTKNYNPEDVCVTSIFFSPKCMSTLNCPEKKKITVRLQNFFIV